jgi:1-acyl-sn-glycerol-3-phosphate acyltransferase
MFYYNFIWICSRILGKLLLRVKIVNARAVPEKGGVILVCNHESFFDPPIVGSSTSRKPVRFMARDSLFEAPVVGWFIKRIKAFPVRRGGADRHAWKLFSDFIKNGELVCFFPEGTRSGDGKLQPANPGSGMLIHRCPGAVILPVRLFGTGKVLHRDMGFQGLHAVSVVFGEPLDLSEEMKKDGDREVYTVIANKVMAAIAALKPPEGRHQELS